MGLYQTQGQLKIEVPSENSLNHEEEAVQVATTGGRIIVYGDSNCLDNSHMQKGLHLRLIISFNHFHFILI